MLAVVAVLGWLSTATLAVNPTVRVVSSPYSQYRGTQLGNGVTQWLGLGFAAPPLENLRFRAPQLPKPTKGVKVADKVRNIPASVTGESRLTASSQHGLICLSTPGSPVLSSQHSEDCLYLDVYAPTAATSDRPVPVYVYIQGGGLAGNANANYNGTGLVLASGLQIAVVTFNYRVGPYGFLASREVQANGDVNNGLKDQRLALQWVQKNIRQACIHDKPFLCFANQLQFGGDPDKVTLGGSSAGAGSVALHLTAYGGRDDGLFHATAAESQSFPTQLTVNESQYQYDGLVQRTGCDQQSDTLACLRSLSTSDLQAQNQLMPTPGGAGGNPLYMYGNVIDGDFTRDLLYKAFRNKQFVKVPSIWGADTNDGVEFAPSSTDTSSAMDTFLRDNFPYLTPAQFATINASYPPAPLSPLTVYTLPGPPETGRYWRAAANAYGDMRYMCPGLYAAAACSSSGTQRAWNFRYNVVDQDQARRGLGVPHTIDTNAVWGPSYVAGSAPASYRAGNANANAVRLMQGYWTSFVRAHDPNVFRAAGTPRWEALNAADLNRIRLETNTSAMENVDSASRRRCQYLWDIASSLHQ